MHNIVKHAHATQVTLVLDCSESQICLEVSDNGVGFDPLAAFPGHLGLQSMRERGSLPGTHSNQFCSWPRDENSICYTPQAGIDILMGLLEAGIAEGAQVEFRAGDHGCLPGIPVALLEQDG